MSRPGILLDRDGTINVDYHYVGHIERVQLIPGAADAIARFNRAGIPVAIVTNQGGVARGFYPEENVHLVHEYIKRELALHGAHVDMWLHSPFHPDAPLPAYRRFIYGHKPNPGMALSAATRLDLDLRNSWVVGDRLTDVEFARNVGAQCVYIGKDEPPPMHPVVHHFPNLADAASFIIERITGMTDNTFPTMDYISVHSYFTHYADELRAAYSKLQDNPGSLIDASRILVSAYEDGDMVFIAGNGGAAAIANHMEADHAKHVGASGEYFTRIHSLCANQSVMTAVANDIGYDSVFSSQIERLASGGDVLVLFSASGNSANVVRAAQSAIENSMIVIAITGFDGGKLADLAGVHIHIAANNYGVIEDVMSTIQHVLAQYIRQRRMSIEAIQSARF